MDKGIKYYFTIKFNNEFLIKRFILRGMDFLMYEAMKQHVLAENINITGVGNFHGDTFISGNYILSNAYDGVVISKNIKNIFSKIVEKEQTIIEDYVRENIKSQFNGV